LITARLPVVVRATPPRYLNFGDSCEFPIVVQNLTENDLKVKLCLRIINGTFADGRTEYYGLSADIPTEGRKLFTVAVLTKDPGTLRLQVCCLAGKYGDASEIEILVHPPATTQSQSVTGDIEGSGDVLKQSIQRPADAIPNYGGIQLSFSTSILQVLLDAAKYLVEYPYGCNEQTSSKLLVLLSLQDYLQIFKDPSIPKKIVQKYLVPTFLTLSGFEKTSHICIETS
jgi:uncharacterized protein YfaS (alpha-2-macroglobulin family)